MENNRLSFYHRLLVHDWFFGFADDYSVWKLGAKEHEGLAKAADQNPLLMPLWRAFNAEAQLSMREERPFRPPSYKELTGMYSGLFIDPRSQTIKQVEYDDDFRSIYTLIGADCFDIVTLPNGDSAFVDDEGLLNRKGENEGFFRFEHYPQPLAGRALVLGCDDEGNTVSAKTSLDQLRASVAWVYVEMPYIV